MVGRLHDLDGRFCVTYVPKDAAACLTNGAGSGEAPRTFAGDPPAGRRHSTNRGVRARPRVPFTSVPGWPLRVWTLDV
jgi:hypothetical protein